MDNLVHVLSFTLPNEAHFAKAFLESNGIDVVLTDELTVQVDNFMSNAIGGIKMLVPASQVESAIDLLKEGGYIKSSDESHNEVFETITVSSKEDMSHCPYCHSSNIAINKAPNWLFILLVFILKAFFPIFKKNYHCFDCDKNWKFKVKK